MDTEFLKVYMDTQAQGHMYKLQHGQEGFAWYACPKPEGRRPEG